MEDFLTTRQVQDLLKVDRITVYRMLGDGRMKGVKIGQQWRFARQEVERILGGSHLVPEPIQPEPSATFPTHCVQTIQDLFSEVGQVGALVVDPQGQPLTEISHPCEFCRLVLSSPSGRQACQATWQQIAARSGEGSQMFTCHAGLQYSAAPIASGEENEALFLAGQFYLQPVPAGVRAAGLSRLAAAHHLPLEALREAAAAVPVIEPAMRRRVQAWPVTAGRAVLSILNERIGFMTRLQQIASLSQFS